MKKPVKSTIMTLAAIIVLYLIFFSVITPYIRGVVIDKETKKPLENAWIMAVAGTTFSQEQGIYPHIISLPVPI